MIEAADFVGAAARRGFHFYTGVPCSYLTPFIDHVIAAPGLRYVGAANEGDAVAIAAGAELGGQRSVVMFQNSGLGNAVSPLTSLTHTFRLPVLVIVTWRGEPGGAPDEPQHELMGGITPHLLELMGIPFGFFPAHADEIDAALAAAVAHMEATGRPYALVMRKGSVAPGAGDAPPRPPRRGAGGHTASASARSQRHHMLQAIQMAAKADDIVIASTGYAGRELYALEDRPNQLYMVGSMGCAAGLGLGLALARPTQRVIVIDGDGAALMRLGLLATLGHERPDNLVHVLIDNGMHESTGGQATVSSSIDFCALAAAAGYPKVIAIGDMEALRAELAWRAMGLRFVHVPVLPGVMPDLPRPQITPAEVAARLRGHLAARG